MTQLRCDSVTKSRYRKSDSILNGSSELKRRTKSRRRYCFAVVKWPTPSSARSRSSNYVNGFLRLIKQWFPSTPRPNPRVGTVQSARLLTATRREHSWPKSSGERRAVGEARSCPRQGTPGPPCPRQCGRWRCSAAPSPVFRCTSGLILATALLVPTSASDAPFRRVNRHESRPPRHLFRSNIFLRLLFVRSTRELAVR